MIAKKLGSVLFLMALATGCEMVPDPDPGEDGGPGPGTSAGMCKSAKAVVGSPTYRTLPDRSMWKPDGHGALEQPPLIAWNLAMRGSQLALSSQESVWVADMAAASPSFKRVLGQDGLQPSQYTPTGACRDARIMVNAGMTYLPDGRLVIGDGWANGVIELSDPTSATCSARPIAGTQVAIRSTDLMRDQIYEQGDVDGPGAQARFRRPQQAVADAAGNVYVWDQSNYKVKKIGTDAAHTVTTIADLTAREPTVHQMTVMNGKLYAAANASGDLIFEVDLAAGGAPRIILDGTGKFDMVPSGAGIPVGLTNDGRDLIVLLWKGYVYRVSTSGETSLMAGAGRMVSSSFPSDLDPSNVPAEELPLDPNSMTQGAGEIGYRDGHVYLPSAYGGTGWTVWDLDCTK